MAAHGLLTFRNGIRIPPEPSPKFPLVKGPACGGSPRWQTFLIYVKDHHRTIMLRHTRSRDTASHQHTRMNAYTRWARLVVHNVSCSTDPRTLALWSEHAGVSEGTLRARCAACGVGVAAARDFSRLLRVVMRSQHGDPGWDPARHLEARDPRTIHRLLVGAGLVNWPHGGPPPAIDQFLDHQHLVHNRAVVAAVRQAIASPLGKTPRDEHAHPRDTPPNTRWPSDPL